ncbi:unnamed protein product [Brassicogethes aeneus]|uniref:PBZ-type domain-containing protein n=1 Tax=Brassicogethes aeneus TaxID=1431903 RepID=A0A9P0FLX9_BRAAE|nr:unnamed protein product [Brassicogethes aeneus]
MDKYMKRKTVESPSESPIKKRKKDDCPHKDRCYRKNPHHFKEFEHPHLVNFIEMGDNLNIPDGLAQPKQVYLEQLDILRPIMKAEAGTVYKETKASPKASPPKIDFQKTSKLFEKQYKSVIDEPSSSKTGSTAKQIERKTGIATLSSISVIQYDKMTTKNTMLDKFEKTAPYNIFFTQIPKSPDTLKQFNSATFTDILCPSLGELTDSLQVNFMIDISWLLEQYKARNVSNKPLTILYGDEFPDMDTFMDRFCPNITYKFVKMKDPFGCHHSKIGIYVYSDKSIRVVVSTANLYYEDWNHYNQAFWMSPRCPKLPENSKETDGESPTGFKISLINYLKHYNFDILNKWISYIKDCDFSAVKVFLVTSVPGKHYANFNTGCHLHRVGDLLSRHCVLPQKTTPESEGPLSWGVFAQASSIGSMGKSPADWLRGCILRSLASHSKSPLPASSNATLNLVYPSVENVMRGYFGAESGGCLPYSKLTNEKQRWLQEYMHQWKADGLTRTKAMPHIKSYTRVSPCMSKLAYFLLTSANLSKSAWGGNIQRDKGISVRSYEVGVMFLPKFFDDEYFEIKNTVNRKSKNVFPFMYDLPLTPYKSDDYPYCN